VRLDSFAGFPRESSRRAGGAGGAEDLRGADDWRSAAGLGMPTGAGEAAGRLDSTGAVGEGEIATVATEALASGDRSAGSGGSPMDNVARSGLAAGGRSADIVTTLAVTRRTSAAMDTTAPIRHRTSRPGRSAFVSPAYASNMYTASECAVGSGDPAGSGR
jgi:hypothetical protein